jgi:hypothetical protein
MKLNKILIVPASYITNYRNRKILPYKNIIKHIFQRNFHEILSEFKKDYLCTEMYHYGDIPKVLGEKNTWILGNYYNEYATNVMDPNTRYISLHNTTPGTHINFKDAFNNLHDFDALLISIRSGKAGEKLRKKAKKLNIFVGIIDYFDDLEIYKNKSIKNLTRNLIYNQDFDIYFKHDIPKGMAEEWLFPLAPMPLRIENYPDLETNWSKKNVPVFYSGRNSHKPRKDRLIITDAIQKHISGSRIKNIAPFEELKVSDYLHNLQNAKICFSPSGKVWDSTRHVELAVYKNVPLIPVPDCETVGSVVKDSINCISYNFDPQKSLSSIDTKEIIEKINFYIKNDTQLKIIAENWNSDIIESHTTIARANYIINSFENSIK